ncbi:MAG: hypothetical protein HQL69_07335 [Magnetococcales bacterium]|nr:hypothetical protein [Magnetococcales bacterium]
MKSTIATLSVAVLLGSTILLTPDTSDAWGWGSASGEEQQQGGRYYPNVNGPNSQQKTYENTDSEAYRKGFQDGLKASNRGGYYPNSREGYNSNYGDQYYPDRSGYYHPSDWDSGFLYPYVGGDYPTNGPASWLPWDLQN